MSFYCLRAHLKRGGVVAYPTESSYGLGCLPYHARGLRRILQIKKRPVSKGLIVIGRSWAQLQTYLQRQPESQVARLNHIWRCAEPTTFLLPCRQLVPPVLRGHGRTQLAVRVPQHAQARRLCEAVGSALVSTSCNRAGKRACCLEREVRRQFGREVWVVGGRTGGRRQASRIVDVVNKRQIR